MFGDSYVYVVFDNGTDLYWARSRVIEYLQQISGRLPTNVHPVIGPDATGADWVYEYAIVDKSGKQSLADLRSGQDWIFVMFSKLFLESLKVPASAASSGNTRFSLIRTSCWPTAMMRLCNPHSKERT